MNHIHGLPTWHLPAPVSWLDPVAGDDRPLPSATVPVLIRVPDVRPVRQARRPSAAATARVRLYGGRRPRRRIRREIRAAGGLMLMVAPLALAVPLLCGGANGSPSKIAVVRPPSVTLSIDGPWQGPEPPVVLPGYVLPDDGTEEPAHAGG